MIYPLTKDDLLASSLYNQYWYYSIELIPEVLTQGAHHLNLGLTRRLLKQCDVEDRNCLDIGTMEAAVPVLLSRRGAAKIVGVDIAPFYDKINAVKHYTRAGFEYYSGLTHGRTVQFLKEKGHINFDVVVLSGVLYHCFGPLHTLAMARSLLKTGGLMIIETFAVLDEQHAMFFNTAGMFTPDPSSYFLISIPLLDYILRYFKLAPLDCVHGQSSIVDGHKCIRFGVVCRAVNDTVADPNDKWMSGATEIVDYRTLFDWDIIDKGSRDPVIYYNEGKTQFLRKDTGTCDLWQAAQHQPSIALEVKDSVIYLQDVF
jgi:SAM-dependent methyltransferase